MKTDTWRDECEDVWGTLSDIVNNEGDAKAKIYLYSVIQELIDKAVKERDEEIIKSFRANRKFWEDEDHAVGGYVSIKEVAEIINNLK